MIRYPIAILLMLAASLPARAEDLLAVYRLARDNDPNWAAARANVAAGRERENQGFSQLLPTLTLGASTYRIDQDSRTATVNDRFRYDSNGYSAVLTQPIYRKQNIAAWEQGKAQTAQAEADYDEAGQNLILRVAGGYFDVLGAQDRLAWARAEKQAVTGQLRLSKRNYEVGQGSLVDVHSAQARLDLVAAEEIAAANDLEVRREALRSIIYTAPGKLADIRSPMPLAGPQPSDIEQWVASALASNPIVRSRAATVEIAAQDVEVSRAGHYPTLDLSASHSYSDAGGSAFGTPIETTTNQVGLVFGMSLFQGGAIASRVREAGARRDAAAQQLEASRRQAAQQTREAYLTVVSGLSRVRALEQALISNRQALESTVLGYERGQRTGLDVLNAQRELFRTQRDAAQARYDYLLARLRLKSAAGTLGEDDVREINALLASS
jgi:outer membrane protein